MATRQQEEREAREFFHHANLRPRDIRAMIGRDVRNMFGTVECDQQMLHHAFRLSTMRSDSRMLDAFTTHPNMHPDDLTLFSRAAMRTFIHWDKQANKLTAPPENRGWAGITDGYYAFWLCGKLASHPSLPLEGLDVILQSPECAALAAKNPTLQKDKEAQKRILTAANAALDAWEHGDGKNDQSNAHMVWYLLTYMPQHADDDINRAIVEVTLRSLEVVDTPESTAMELYGILSEPEFDAYLTDEQRSRIMVAIACL